MSDIKNNQTFEANPLFPTGATLDYVPTCTDATTGAWTWQAAGGGGGGTTVTLTTTDTTPTIMLSIPIPLNQVLTIEGFLTAASADYSNVTTARVFFSGVNLAGSINYVDNNPEFIILGPGNTQVVPWHDSTDLQLQVTGLSSTTYNWTFTYNTYTV